MRLRAAFLLLAGVLTVSCDAATPTSPTSVPPLATSIRMGTATVSVTGTYFWRDWMPIVQKPGPDGGSPLMAVIQVAIVNMGAADSATLLCTVRAASENDYPMTTTVTDLATGGAWDGTIPANGRVNLSVSLRDGPYLPLKSTVFAVLTWNNDTTRAATMRSLDAQVQGTM